MIKTIKDIKKDKRVSSLELEIDGSHRTYWCYLKHPYRFDDDCSAIHEPTIKQICFYLNSNLVYDSTKI